MRTQEETNVLMWCIWLLLAMTVIYIIISWMSISYAGETNVGIIYINTPDKVASTFRFQGMIIIGGNVELKVDKWLVYGDNLAFNEWLESRTLKELIDLGYALPFFQWTVIGE